MAAPVTSSAGSLPQAAPSSGSSHPSGGAHALKEQLAISLCRPRLWEKCRDLSRLLAGHPALAGASGGSGNGSKAKLLRTAFTQIVQDVFGNPGHHVHSGGAAGWGLGSLCKNSGRSRDYLAALAFLASDGPLFDLMERLLLACASSMATAEETMAFQAMSPGSFGRREQGAPAALSYMTPFEYYMHLFAQVPLAGGQQPSVSPTNGWSADSLYPFLLEDYLNAFLPLDESSQAKLYSSCAASHPSFPATVAQPAPMMTMMAYRPQFKSPSTTGGLSLFRQGLGQPATKASPAPPPGPQGLKNYLNHHHHHQQDCLLAHHQLGGVSNNDVDCIPTRTPHHFPGSFSANAGAAAATSAWKTETLVRTLVAIWLEPYSTSSPPWAPSSSPFVRLPEGLGAGRQPFVYPPLPSCELVLCVRMLVKHGHYFSDACRQGGQYLPTNLKHDTFASEENRKQLYAFLAHSVDHWPLDASFRIVLETWLSYIQPWRYARSASEALLLKPASNDDNIQQHGDARGPDVVSLWTLFVNENLRFYSNLLGKVLARFFRLDLTSPKNAHMLFRVAKVYSQDNFMAVLSRVSAIHGAYHGLSSMSPNSSPKRSFLLVQPDAGSNQTTLQGGSMTYFDDQFHNQQQPTTTTSILGPEFKELVLALLRACLDAKKTLANRQEEQANLRRHQAAAQATTSSTAAAGSWSSQVIAAICRLFVARPAMGREEESDRAEAEKVAQNLDYSVEKLSQMFELKAALEVIFSQEAEAAALESSPSGGVPDAVDSSSITQFTAAGLSPQQRQDILMKRARIEARYEGNPDTVPVRSDEFGFLVRWLLHLSGLINRRWPEQIGTFYYREPGFLYSVFRQLCAPPCVYRTRDAREPGNGDPWNRAWDHRDETGAQPANLDSSFAGGQLRRRLPPRVNLRPLASFRCLAYTGLFLLFLRLLLGRSWLGAVVHLILSFVALVVVKAVVAPCPPLEVDLTQGCCSNLLQDSF